MNRYDLSRPEDRVLPRILQWQGVHSADRDFLIRDDRRITFAEADRATDALAIGLAGLGVARGDRVALYLTGRPEMVLSALALGKLGAVWVPISTDYKGDWLADAVRRSQCRAIVTESALAANLASVRDQLGDERLVLVSDGSDGPGLEGAIPYDSLLVEAAPPADCGSLHYGDTCAILWTSGTTGRSKAVEQSHNTWLRAVNNVIPQHGSTEGDVVYNVLPLFNTGGWVTSIFRALAEGLPCVLDEPFSVTHFWDRIRKFGATQTFTLGAMHMFLWNAPPRPDDADNPLRVAQMVPFPADLVEPFERRFGLRLLGAGYGQSECPLICSLEERGAPPGAIGRPAPDTDIRCFDDDDREVPDGEVGEIRIRPLEPHLIFNGYFGDEEATKAAFRGPGSEWYCTGDLGRRDETGMFYFVDRKKDAVRFAGRNISTMQVEGVLRRHPDVADVAAYGIPSAELSSEDELKVDIVPEAGKTLSYEDLASYVNDNAPHYFVPRYMEIVEALPYTPTGKVEKYKLRDRGVRDGTWDRRASGYRVRR